MRDIHGKKYQWLQTKNWQKVSTALKLNNLAHYLSLIVFYWLHFDQNCRFWSSFRQHSNKNWWPPTENLLSSKWPTLFVGLPSITVVIFYRDNCLPLTYKLLWQSAIIFIFLWLERVECLSMTHFKDLSLATPTTHFIAGLQKLEYKSY